MKKILLHHCRALCMDEENRILNNAYVVVEGETISAVSETKPEGPFDETIDCKGNVLMPGLVNAHTHIPMTVFRGYAGGYDLQTWLTQWIFPAEDKLDGRAVRAGSALALADLIASGVTTIADMYMFCEDIAEEVAKAGISANISRSIVYFGDPNEFNFHTDPRCADTRRLKELWHGHNNGQIQVEACVHGEYTSQPAVWAAVADYARENRLGMHVHVSETQSEHEECKKRWGGKTPIQILDHYGVWDTRSLAAHCVWTEDADWEIMKNKGVSCVHNPVSNLKLGSGVAWIPDMRKAGVNVALGTDGVSSNNSHDMFEEMKFAATIHCGVRHDPLAIRPMDVLSMATRDGAKALGRKTGVIAPGYTADLILVDFDRPGLFPCHSIPDNLVYSTNGNHVILNMARGRVIYKDGEFFTIDLAKVKAEMTNYAMPLLFG